jgi:hypothetical protein
VRMLFMFLLSMMRGPTLKSRRLRIRKRSRCAPSCHLPTAARISKLYLLVITVVRGGNSPPFVIFHVAAERTLCNVHTPECVQHYCTCTVLYIVFGQSDPTAQILREKLANRPNTVTSRLKIVGVQAVNCDCTACYLLPAVVCSAAVYLASLFWVFSQLSTHRRGKYKNGHAFHNRLIVKSHTS